MEPEGSLLDSQVPTTCSYPELALSSPYPHITLPWRSTLILSSHLCLGLPSGLFPSGFATKTLYTPLLSPLLTTCPAHLILLEFYHPNNIGLGVQFIKHLIMYFPPLPCYLSLLGPNILNTLFSDSLSAYLLQWLSNGFASISAVNSARRHQKHTKCLKKHLVIMPYTKRKSMNGLSASRVDGCQSVLDDLQPEPYPKMWLKCERLS